MNESLLEYDIVSGTWNSYGYYWGTGEETDGLMQPGLYMVYQDISHRGIRYRAVEFVRYRPTNTGGTSAAGSTQQDDNGYYPGNIYFFKYEPLRWRVLDPAAGLVLCEDIVDAQAYQNVVYKNGSEYYQGIESEVYANDYAASSIRQWLLNDFYQTAFTSEEQAKIAYTALDNSEYSSTHPEFNSESTFDKLFLLSFSDVQNEAYGFTTNKYLDETRIGRGTDYAKCQNLWAGEGGAGPSFWWLRSPWSKSRRAATVNAFGAIAQEGSGFVWAGGYSVDIVYMGVRPAFNFVPGILEPLEDNECTEHIAGDPEETVLTAPTCGACLWSEGVAKCP